MRYAIPGVLIAAAIGIVIWIFASNGSVTEHIGTTYTETDTPEGREEENGVTFYSADTTPDVTAQAIADAWSPSERADSPAGAFLLYRAATVAITSDGGDGSLIEVDRDNERAYRRHYYYVGGSRNWGTYVPLTDSRSTGGGFRGGGPGAGK